MLRPAHTPKPRKSRLKRIITGVVLAALLPSCAPVSTESPFWATLAAAVPGRQPPPVTRAQADALPYASMLVWFEDAPQAFVVLGEILDGQQLAWYSASRQVIVTQGCFVVKTAGLESDLSGTRFPGQVPDLRQAGAGLTRHIDVQARNIYGFPLVSRFDAKGLEEVEVLDRTYQLMRVEEQVTAGQLRYRNTHWIDPDTGACLKSRQQLTPDSPVLNLEVLKPPAL